MRYKLTIISHFDSAVQVAPYQNIRNRNTIIVMIFTQDNDVLIKDVDFIEITKG